MCGLIGMIQLPRPMQEKRQYNSQLASKEKPADVSANVTPALLSALHRLEYRGYDSAGLCVQTATGLSRHRMVGRVSELENLLGRVPLEGHTGIAHTRWATHGGVEEKNAHPQGHSDLMVVHNGIVENAQSLRQQLEYAGTIFQSETDTEVIVHMLWHSLKNVELTAMAPEALQKIIRLALKPLKGSFALLIMLKGLPQTLIAFRQGFAPLTLGKGDHCLAVGSDAVALSGLASKLFYLKHNDLAILSAQGILLYGIEGEKPVVFSPNPVQKSSLTKGRHAHFMHKEMHEQPTVLSQLLKIYRPIIEKKDLDKSALNFAGRSGLWLTGCGTAFYAAAIASYFFQKMAKMPVMLETAAELRHKKNALGPGSLMGAISQSGETADTLSAVDAALKQGANVFTVINVPESSMDRLSVHPFYTHAGSEVGVASTKAFLSQLWVLSLLALQAGRERATVTAVQEKEFVDALASLPFLLKQTLACEPSVARVSHYLKQASSCLFLGRGALAPLAMEGALKMKELSYIHAEGYPAGELKHGPIALLEQGFPCIILAPSDDLFQKNISAVREVAARGAYVLVLTDASGALAFEGVDNLNVLQLPNTNEVTAPFVYGAAVQLLAYYTALLRGTDVDRPRNLAKSVTVE